MKPVGKPKRLKGEAAAREASEDLKTRNARLENAPIQFPDINFNFNARLAIEKKDGVVSVLSRFHYFNGPVEVTDNAATDMPAALFPDNATIEKFAVAVNRAFATWLHEALTDEATMHLSDVIHFTVNHLELDTIDMRAQAKLHGRETQRRALERMGLQRAGRARQWQKSELARAILNELRAATHRERTYQGIAARLQNRYGEKAPKSGDSLRKMIESLGLDWQKLKSGRY